MSALAGWSLRRRLVVGVATVVAVVVCVLGLVATLAVRGILLDRLDGDLGDSLDRFAAFDGGPPPGADGRTGPGEAEGSLLAVVTADGTVRGAYLDPDLLATGADQPYRALDADVAEAVGGLDDGYTTTDLGDLGSYRLLARAGDGGTTVVAGTPTDPVDGPTRTLLLVEVGLAVVAIALSVLAVAALVRRALRPLERVAATATSIAARPLDRGDVDLAERVDVAGTDPRTEVGRLGTSVNLMLDNLGSALSARHESETRVRRFVADASHELRTPLTAIRGYAELSLRAADDVPTDVAYALERIHGEGSRMSDLVDDLLLLARLDEGRPLDVGEVDVVRLVLDAVNDARVSAPDHRWRLSVPSDGALGLSVRADAARLHQVVANLLRNATVHTPPGTTVSTSVTTDRRGGAEHVLVEVYDDGPGLPEELRGQAFDRFVRGDASRARATGSTGLGLAIVRAVGEALGGETGVRSRPGDTTFWLRLPAHSRPTD